jgi:hypothetical protein
VEIQIQRQSSKCLGCDKPFSHEQKHFSLLKIESSNFLREDYCETCWLKRSQFPSTGEIYSQWETKYCDPSVAKATPEEQFKPLLDICYESIAQGEPETEAMAYMCSLVLRRQKIFRFIREEKEDSGKRKVLVFTDKYNDTQLRIVDPQLTESQLENTRRALQERLGQPRGNGNERENIAS